MKVTIEGNLEQVTEALRPDLLKATTPRQIKIKENRQERDKFLARRAVVLDAFKKIRHSADDRENSDTLLNALRKPKGVSDDDIKLAQQILGPC